MSVVDWFFVITTWVCGALVVYMGVALVIVKAVGQAVADDEEVLEAVIVVIDRGDALTAGVGLGHLSPDLQQHHLERAVRLLSHELVNAKVIGDVCVEIAVTVVIEPGRTGAAKTRHRKYPRLDAHVRERHRSLRATRRRAEGEAEEAQGRHDEVGICDNASQGGVVSSEKRYNIRRNRSGFGSGSPVKSSKSNLSELQ